MPKTARKGPSAKGKPSKKGGKRKGSKKFIVLFAIVGVLLVAELFSYANNKANESKIITVQNILEFNGDTQDCGAFKAWDLLASANGFALTDQGQNRILLFDPQGKFLSQIDKKAAGDPDFKEVSCLTSDPSGNLYVMDTWNGLIRGFDAKNHSILKLDLGGKGFYGPRGLAWDNNSFLIADTGSHRLVKVSVDGNIQGAWGNRGSGKGLFNNPYQVVTDGQGLYYVVDRDNNRIQVLDSQGHYAREIGIGAPPTAEAIDLQKKWLYVTSLDGRFVKAYTLEGKFIGNLSEAGQKGQPMPDINALSVLANGDVAMVRGGSKVIVFHALPAANPS